MSYRQARAEDVPAIVAMLRDDHLGATRESAIDDPIYAAAFERIDAHPSQELWVVDSAEGVVGSLQLSFIQGLGRRAALRALVESVRIHGDFRGQGYGTAFLRHVIAHARARGAKVVQLTTDKSRPDARRFYLALGFVDSHVGMKLAL